MAMAVALTAALDLMLAWLIRRMVVQAKRYRSLGPNSEPCSIREDWPRVAVVVPARDEAASIAACVTGILGQDYPHNRLSLCVVDDGSRDCTARFAAQAAANDPRLRLVTAAAVPAGWTGKSHAIATGVFDLGRVGISPDYLCFIDADTVAEPGLLRAAVAHARATGIDMLSLGPRQVLGSWAERLVMPCGLYLVAASRDVGRLNAPDSSEAAANGQFLLFRRESYERLGGHARVQAEICEDTALARCAKAMGLRFTLIGAEPLIRTRMYRSASALWVGLSKNVTELGGGPRRTIMIATAGLALALAVPAVFVVCVAACLVRPTPDAIAAAGLSGAGLLAVIGLHIAGTRHFRIPPYYGLLFPLGYGLCLALALNGARLARRGRVTWKGRTYASGPTAISPTPLTPNCGEADV